MTRNPETPDRLTAMSYSNPSGQSLEEKTSTPENSLQPMADTPRLPPSQLPVAAETESEESDTLPLDKEQLPPNSRFSFLSNWLFWTVFGLVGYTAAGFASLSMLVKLPESPKCSTISWATASASVRLECARAAADKHTVDDLLRAIALVKDLPKNHPLRDDIDKHIEDWSTEILQLADVMFQEGKMTEAISVARQIPPNTSASKLVEEHIQDWQSVWAKGEEIYQRAEELLRGSYWHDAFLHAARLTNLDNKFWATTKYEELVGLIQAGKEDSSKLDKAYQLLRRGGLENLAAAISIAEKVNAQSYAYQEAQKLIAKCGDALIELAQGKLAERNWQDTLDVVAKIPSAMRSKPEVQELTDLATAMSQADQGMRTDLERAIALAQKIQPNSKFYLQAQQSIVRWQVEIGDVTSLQRAQELADVGGANNLKAAIAEAQKIGNSNPRAGEARSQIDRWQQQIEISEDQPYLDRAIQIADAGTPNALQQAIAQAGKIRSGRTLYPEAQERIRQWTYQIQSQQDQPTLDRAVFQANSGNITSAIDTAQRIRPGRLLYGEAQDRIRQWSRQSQSLEDRPFLDRAISEANAGNLSGAIVSAQEIREGRALYSEAQSRIRQWNRQIQQIEDRPYLDQANAEADAGNFSNAIVIAQQIGSGRALYGEAQSQVRRWQREIQSQDNLQTAYQLASPGNPEALVQAIQTARQVPSSSKSRPEAKAAINRWSTQLFIAAQEVGVSDISNAIALTQAIPPGTDVYQSAQQQIQIWQNSNF